MCDLVYCNESVTDGPTTRLMERPHLAVRVVLTNSWGVAAAELSYLQWRDGSADSQSTYTEEMSSSVVLLNHTTGARL